MIEVNNFDVLPSEAILEEVAYFPEDDNFNLRFQLLQYNSSFAVPNLGSIFLIGALTCLILPLVYAFYGWLSFH